MAPLLRLDEAIQAALVSVLVLVLVRLFTKTHRHSADGQLTPRRPKYGVLFVGTFFIVCVMLRAFRGGGADQQAEFEVAPPPTQQAPAPRAAAAPATKASSSFKVVRVGGGGGSGSAVGASGDADDELLAELLRHMDSADPDF